MPGRVTQVDLDQIVADLLTDKRRMVRALTSVQVPTWTHDIFTAPATYQLTRIPYGINALADNGVMLSEGTDYTVDYTTGVITFTTGRTAGHTIFVSYVTTGDLIALTGTPDYGGFTDTFNRADNTSTLGTTSDGHATWTAAVGTWGISTNAAKMFDGLGSNDQAYIDCGASDGTIQVVLATLDNVGGARAGGPMFRWSDSSNYFYIACEDIAGATHVTRVTAGLKNTIGSSFTTTVGDTVTVILSGGTITVQVNGTTAVTVSDSQNQTATKHGLYSETQVTHFDSWSFSA